MTNMIGFPGLGLSFTVNRVAFSIGIRDIYWYGIIIGAAILCGVAMASREARRIGLPKDTVVDLSLFAVPMGVVSARLYFVLWNLGDYTGQPLEIFNLRGGGLAIYGGIIGGVLTAWVFCRVKKLDIRKVFDAGVFGIITGQIIGRWGNFVNAEAFGSETSLPWRMEIYSGELGRLINVHPTFLYESLWNLAGLAGMLFFRAKKTFQGELFLLYVAWYGLGRSWIEQLRVDSLPYEASFKISQIVAIVSAAAAVVLWVVQRRKALQDA